MGCLPVDKNHINPYFINPFSFSIIIFPFKYSFIKSSINSNPKFIFPLIANFIILLNPILLKFIPYHMSYIFVKLLISSLLH